MPEDEKLATFCDRCGKGLAFGPTGIMRDTGRRDDDDGLLIVTILCHDCAGYGDGKPLPPAKFVFIDNGEIVRVIE